MDVMKFLILVRDSAEHTLTVAGAAFLGGSLMYTLGWNLPDIQWDFALYPFYMLGYFGATVIMKYLKLL